jgi:hypothetical protein
MKTIKESILTSTHAGQNVFITKDPEEFAKVYFGCNKDNEYFVNKDKMEIDIWRVYRDKIIIDKNFPDIEFMIGELGDLSKPLKIYIKDCDILKKHFMHNWAKCKFGGPRTTIYLQDPKLQINQEFCNLYEFEGKLVIEQAERVFRLPETNGEIILYKKNIQLCAADLNINVNQLKKLEVR